MLRTTSFPISICTSCMTDPMITTTIIPYNSRPLWVSLSISLANHCQSLTAYEDTAFFTYLLTLLVRWAHNAIASHLYIVLSLWLLSLDREHIWALDSDHALMSSLSICLYGVCWTSSQSSLLLFEWTQFTSTSTISSRMLLLSVVCSPGYVSPSNAGVVVYSPHSSPCYYHPIFLHSPLLYHPYPYVQDWDHIISMHNLLINISYV